MNKEAMILKSDAGGRMLLPVERQVELVREFGFPARVSRLWRGRIHAPRMNRVHAYIQNVPTAETLG